MRATDAIETKTLDWEEEHTLLLAIIYPFLLAAAVNGAKTALAELALLGVGVDWALVNQAVVDWARRYSYNLVRQINATTQKYLQTVVPDWINSGAPLDVLAETLAPMFGVVRAEMIAVTEVTRAYAEGNIETWRESGVVSGKRWMTANDDLVCPICAPLDGMMVGLDENGFTTEAGGLGLDAPPAHVRCRCWLQPVVE